MTVRDTDGTPVGRLRERSSTRKQVILDRGDKHEQKQTK